MMIDKKKELGGAPQKTAALLSGSGHSRAESPRPPARDISMKDILLPPINIENDGVTEINIYADGRTTLGRMLAPVTHMPFVHPAHGSFQNLQGFWEWITSEERPDALRYLSGHQAVTVGRKLTRVYLKDFEDQLLQANFCRIDQNEQLLKLFLASSLPFEMYYLKDPSDPASLPIRPGVRKHMVKCFTDLRILMQHDERPQGLENYIRPYSSR